ncbi:MAG TPA: hypothetical protein VF469_21450 [Kofleriaceae bacterium]
MRSPWLVLAALAFSACVPAELPPPATTAAWLSPDQSTTYVAGQPTDVARKLTDLFGGRGAAMVDEKVILDGFDLTFKASRGSVVATEYRGWTYSSAVGSVFHVSVQQVAAGVCAIHMAGEPTLDGTSAPATIVTSAREEAEMIHGVLAQLTIYGMTVPEPPGVHAVEAAQARARVAAERAAIAPCLAKRHEIFQQASKMTDLDQRGKLLMSAPECPAAGL